MSDVSAALRRLVIARAGGCCEYCLISQNNVTLTFHVEHIIAESHGGASSEDNLAWSCPTCNLYKSVNVAGIDPLTEEAALLFHPRRQTWSEHFTLQGAKIFPLTAEGRTTLYVLRFNLPHRVEKRKFLLELELYPCNPTSED